MAQAQPATDQPATPEQPEAALAVDDAPDLPDEVGADLPTAELDPKDRLARWQRKLMDLSLRNALLNFKAGKKALLLGGRAALPDRRGQGVPLT